MKKTLLLSIVILTLTTCQQHINEPSYKITGTVQGLDNGTVYLHSKKLGIDQTTEIKNATFVFEGVLAEPCRCVLRIDGVEGEIKFFLENSDIKIEANKESLSKAFIVGSKMQSDLVAYEKSLESVKIKYKYEEINAEWDTANKARRAELDLIFDDYDRDMWAAKKQFVIDNPASYYSTIILWDIDWLFTADEFDVFISQLDTSLNGYSYYEEIKDMFNRLRNVEVGKITPDFTMTDTEGNQISMSEICKESKYMIIDFWSSGCGSCRIENQNLVKAYKRFHDKGLNIIGVSTDEKKENWLKAIQKDNIDDWVNVCNFNKWKNNEVVKLYALQQQSENLLVDSTGKIILRNVKGEELQKRLEELFN